MEQVKKNLRVLATGHLFKVSIILLFIVMWTGGYDFRTGMISGASQFATTRLVTLTNYYNPASIYWSHADSFYQPPVLCYHQVRDWKAYDSKSDRAYIMPVKTFNEHMKILHESGYQTLLPEEWLGYMKRRERLPEKCFISLLK